LHSILFNSNNKKRQWTIKYLQKIQSKLLGSTYPNCNGQKAGYIVSSNYNIQYCPSQANLRKYKSYYRIYLFSVFHYKHISYNKVRDGSGPPAFIQIDYEGKTSDCAGSTGTHFKNRSQECKKGLNQELGGNEVFNLDLNMPIKDTKSLLEKTYININASLGYNKKLFRESCQGFGWMSMSKCNNNYTRAVQAELALLISQDGDTENTVVESFFDNSSTNTEFKLPKKGTPLNMDFEALGSYCK
jgi:hypothetical protein